MTQNPAMSSEIMMHFYLCMCVRVIKRLKLTYLYSYFCVSGYAQNRLCVCQSINNHSWVQSSSSFLKLLPPATNILLNIYLKTYFKKKRIILPVLWQWNFGCARACVLRSASAWMLTRLSAELCSHCEYQKYSRSECDGINWPRL